METNSKSALSKAGYSNLEDHLEYQTAECSSWESPKEQMMGLMRVTPMDSMMGDYSHLEDRSAWQKAESSCWECPKVMMMGLMRVSPMDSMMGDYSRLEDRWA